MALETFDFDPSHSSISFSVRHMVVSKVTGRFTKWSGTLQFDESAPSASKVEVQIEASTVETHDPKRDEHLRSGDFLDVAKYPLITFKAKRVEATARAKAFRVVGDLTIHGVTQEVPLEVEYAGRVKDPWGGERIGFAARTEIDRKRFGLSWGPALEAGGVVVGDKVAINIEIESVKSAKATAA